MLRAGQRPWQPGDAGPRDASGAPRDAASYRPERFVADVARVLDHLDAARAVVGGLSMGAGVALIFAEMKDH